MFKLEEVLAKFPIFSSLDKAGIKHLSSIAALREFKRGQIIYKEKDRPDNLYVVFSGRVKTYTESSQNEKRVLEHLYKGTCFGIISLFTDELHSVTAQAASDSLIIEIPKDKFNQFLKQYPHLALEFSRILSRRVKKRADKDKNIFESAIISVYSLFQASGKTSYSLGLAKALACESRKKVILVELRNKRQGFGLGFIKKVLSIRKFKEAVFEEYLEKKWGFDFIGLSYEPDFSDSSKVIPLFISFLTGSYNFVILDLPSTKDSLTALLLIESDFIHILSSGSSSLKNAKKSSKLLTSAYDINEDKIRLVLNKVSPGVSQMLDSKSKIFATLPSFKIRDPIDIVKDYPNTAYGLALRRIARQISSVRIGLALGSGAAFGAAHVGVLKVLEENKVNIDIVSGSSMGSIVVALWGLGKSWIQIRDLIYKFKEFPVFSFLDVGFSGKSFLRGRYLKNLLKDLFGDATFHDLKRPIFIVTFDFKQRKACVLSSGKFLIRKAVLASCSMPGIFAPVKVKDDLLLDGGVLNPLPVGCLMEEGIKKIISVCVTPSKEEIRQVYGKTTKDKFNVFDFIFGSIEAMQEEIFQRALSLSDVVIHPRFGGIDWTNFKNIDYFIKSGEVEALKQIDKIKELERI
ncbi:MAG: patatin-like phospholipase family protein [Candidatus Omnitrophica bacterium]|nr:patatin-like phospholipase family protein [Candidatus Omnitrophota bacterium]